MAAPRASLGVPVFAPSRALQVLYARRAPTTRLARRSSAISQERPTQTPSMKTTPSTAIATPHRSEGCSRGAPRGAPGTAASGDVFANRGGPGI